jgi:hypothetical protein
MSSYAPLTIDGVEVASFRNGVDLSVALLFGPREFHSRPAVGDEVERWEHYGEDEEVTIHELISTGVAVRDRLDALGLGLSLAEEVFDQLIAEELETEQRFIMRPARTPEITEGVDEEVRVLKEMTLGTWIERVRELHKLGNFEGESRNVGTFRWLIGLWEESDSRLMIRALLAALPETAEVRIDVTDIVDGGYMSLATNPHDEALEWMGDEIISGTPVVILTEGVSDTRILEQTLEVLRPHLKGYLRFPDFSLSPDMVTKVMDQGSSISVGGPEQRQDPGARVGGWIDKPQRALPFGQQAREAGQLGCLAEHAMQILAIGVVRTLGEVSLLCNPPCRTSIPRTTDQRFSNEFVVLTEPHEHTGQQPRHRHLCQPVLHPRLEGPGPCGCYRTPTSTQSRGGHELRRRRGHGHQGPRREAPAPAADPLTTGWRRSRRPRSEVRVAASRDAASVRVSEPGVCHVDPFGSSDDWNRLAIDRRFRISHGSERYEPQGPQSGVDATRCVSQPVDGVQLAVAGQDTGVPGQYARPGMGESVFNPGRSLASEDAQVRVVGSPLGRPVSANELLPRDAFVSSDGSQLVKEPLLDVDGGHVVRVAGESSQLSLKFSSSGGRHAKRQKATASQRPIEPSFQLDGCRYRWVGLSSRERLPVRRRDNAGGIAANE